NTEKPKELAYARTDRNESPSLRQPNGETVAPVPKSEPAPIRSTQPSSPAPAPISTPPSGAVREQAKDAQPAPRLDKLAMQSAPEVSLPPTPGVKSSLPARDKMERIEALSSAA